MKDISTEIAELTPAQLSVLKSRLRRERQPRSAYPLLKRTVSSPCPASANQSWLCSVDQQTNGNPAWNVFTGGHFVGPLNLEALERALNEIIDRHEVLRTTFSTVDGQVTQIIHPHYELHVPVVDLREIDERDRQEVARQQIRERFQRIFDLSASPPIRPTLFRLGQEEHQMLVVMHHTITDWVSFMLLNKEWAILYEAFSKGSPSPLPALPIQYGDYAVSERAWLDSDSASKQLAYWKEQLANAPRDIRLPYDYTRPSKTAYWGDRVEIRLDPEVSESIRILSAREALTPFITTLAIFYVTLHRYSAQDEIVIGTPVIGRKHSEIENLIGLFLNHLALSVDLSGDPTFRQLLGRVRTVVMNGYQNQDLPFGRLVEELSPAGEPARNPIFQVMFFFLAVPTVSKFSNLTVKPFEAYAGTARYDLLVSLWDKPQGIGGFFEYNTALFKPETMAQLVDSYRLLAGAITADPDQRLSDLSR